MFLFRVLERLERAYFLKVQFGWTTVCAIRHFVENRICCSKNVSAKLLVFISIQTFHRANSRYCPRKKFTMQWVQNPFKRSTNLGFFISMRAQEVIECFHGKWMIWQKKNQSIYLLKVSWFQFFGVFNFPKKRMKTIRLEVS